MCSTTSNSPIDLVARFLRTNNYPQTLSAFIAEADLSNDAGSVGADDSWTIEKVLEEKIAFDKTVEFERQGEDQGGERDKWNVPGRHPHHHVQVDGRLKACNLAPCEPTIVGDPNPSNLLSVSVLPSSACALENAGQDETCSIVATNAERRLNVFDTTDAEHALTVSHTGLTDSPILSCISVRNGTYLAMTSMSGKLLVTRGSDILDERKDHTKYAVQVAAYDEIIEQTDDSRPRRTWLATAGWDGKVLVYCTDWTQTPLIAEPLGTITLTTSPVCVLFFRKRDTGDLLLIVSRRDSTYLYYYLVESGTATMEAAPTRPETEHDKRLATACRYIGKQNLAPHSNAWVAFTPSSLAISPHDPELLAVATSSLPHMKVIIVRLLTPSTEDDEDHDISSRAYDPAVSQQAQALASLAIQNREDAAILVQTSTMAPQTAYSTPQVVWRPDGSGVWVNGDDGVVRGIEAKTGKVIASLTKGHVPGSKIRSLWAGWVGVGGGSYSKEEWMISGGFDKRLVIWKISHDSQQ